MVPAVNCPIQEGDLMSCSVHHVLPSVENEPESRSRGNISVSRYWIRMKERAGLTLPMPAAMSDTPTSTTN